jgi:hypothetical protein
MIIDNLKSEKANGRKRISATVRWEDCDRPAYDLFFETDEAYADGFFCNPHAFLLGTIIPAFHYGEQRVSMREAICPELKEGITAVQRILRYWYYTSQKKLIEIDAKMMAPRTVPGPPRRAGFFFSGGIDSFATICANRINYPADHPRAIRDGFVVFGLEQDDPALFKHVLNTLKKFDDKDGFTIIPVYTNVYMNFREEDAADAFKLWRYEFGGAALASIAHAFAQRVSTVSIASSSHLYEMEPWGSHPLVDAHFSSGDLRIIHDNLALTRLDKIKLVAGWDLALQNIRVCNRYKHYREGKLNCGECEKCVRTMLGLLAIGALDKTDAFPARDVSRELVLGNASKLHHLVLLKPMYEEIIAELKQTDRHDLIRAIEEMMNPPAESFWKRKLVQFDKKFLNSRLGHFKKTMVARGGNRG